MAVFRVADPTLREAAVFLRDFRDLVDSISDGWAYWSHGRACSEDLQRIVAAAGFPNGDRWPAKAVADAKRKIVVFLKTCKQTKDNKEVVEWIRQHTA